MTRDVAFFGFYLTITAGLAQAFFDGTEQIQDYPLAMVALAVAVATLLTTLTALWLQHSDAQTQVKAVEAQAAHQARLRRIDRDNGRGDPV